MILKLLGIDGDGVVTNVEWYFRRPWPMLALVACVAAVVVYALVLYHREALKKRYRLFLGLLRAVLLALVVFTLFEPMLGIELQVKLRKNLLVLVDTSESMTIKDNRRTPAQIEEAAIGLGKTPFPADGKLGGQVSLSEQDRQASANVLRIDLARAMLQNPGMGMAQLARDHQVKYFGFGRNLFAAGGQGDQLPQSLRVGGDAGAGAPRTGQGATSPGGGEDNSKATFLGDCIAKALATAGGQQTSGIIVITDGASNGGSEPLDAAAELKEKGVPLFTIGVGLPDPMAVRAKSLIVQDTVFVGDTVPVKVQIVTTGYVGNKGRLTAKLDGKLVDQRDIILKGSQFEELSFTPDHTSRAAKLEVNVSQQPGEAEPANNTIAKNDLRIIDDKIKVLYIEGKPRWEYRYLRRVLLRDHRLLTKFLMTEGDKELAKYSQEYLAEFPEEKGEAFKYDLIILGDVPASYFTGEQLSRIAELVGKQGSSLAMIAGPKNTLTYANTAIESILPVRFRNESYLSVDEMAHPVVTADGYRSALMALEPTKEGNDALWSVVKPMNMLPPLAGAKPGAIVLAELSSSAGRPDAYPLIAWQRVGSGKSLYVGSDDIWRLRLKVGDKYHARFWGQAIQFLTLSRLLGQNKRIQIETDQADCRTGQRVGVSANVLNEAYDPLVAGFYGVVVERAEGGAPVTVKLEPSPGVPGFYQGFFTPEKEGRYTIKAPQADAAFANEAAVRVTAASLEMLEPAMQEQTLRKMAELSGGRYFTVAQLPELRSTIAGEQRVMTVRRELSLWNLPALLGLVLVVAGLEWFFRRKQDLL
jgi:hypothetical protein